MSKLSDVVHLVLEYRYYDAIDRGEKRTEYRDNTKYWRSRILFKRFAVFHKGYTKTTMIFEINYLVVPKPNNPHKIEIHLGQRVS